MHTITFHFSLTDYSDSDRFERFFDSEDEEFEILSLWRMFAFARLSKFCGKASSEEREYHLTCVKHTAFFLNRYADCSVSPWVSRGQVSWPKALRIIRMYVLSRIYVYPYWVLTL